MNMKCEMRRKLLRVHGSRIKRLDLQPHYGADREIGSSAGTGRERACGWDGMSSRAYRLREHLPQRRDSWDHATEIRKKFRRDRCVRRGATFPRYPVIPGGTLLIR